ncbi:MAG: peptide chain release factor 1 [Clostridia bacterium]|nr:peptide chain release factor 1 [Clostridia bacterium]
MHDTVSKEAINLAQWLDTLKQHKERHALLEHLLASPETVSDSAKYASVLKEYSSLTPIVEKVTLYEETESRLTEADQLRRNESDEELRALAEEEYREAQDALDKLRAELRLFLVPRDPNDDKNVIVEIRAGAGGDEAALFVAVLYRMYVMYATAHGFKTEFASATETGLGGDREITFLVSGEWAYSRFKFESGVHRVQRVPETESSGRIHTSTVTVAVLPEAEEVQVEINPADIHIESIKSSGAGGQHINKTESAVRLIHKPTGIVIECQNERSQFQNKDKAMRLLRAKLFDQKQSEQANRIASERKSQVGTGDRSERIRTYNYPQGRVTDHRIGLTSYALDTFLNGDMDFMTDALAEADAAAKLAEKEGGQP